MVLVKHFEQQETIKEPVLFLVFLDHTKICQQLKKPAGLHVVQPNPDDLKSRIDEGYQLLAYSIDAVFLNNQVTNPIK